MYICLLYIKILPQLPDHFTQLRERSGKIIFIKIVNFCKIILLIIESYMNQTPSKTNRTERHFVTYVVNKSEEICFLFLIAELSIRPSFKLKTPVNTN